MSSTLGGPVRAATGPAGATRVISPGDGQSESLVLSICPTFSWLASANARDQLIVVYQTDGQPFDTTAEPVLRVELPGGASSWTPSAEACLETGKRYAWAVGAIAVGGETSWSSPGLFRIAAAEPRADGRGRPRPSTASIEPGQPAARQPGAGLPLQASDRPNARTANAYSPPACIGTFTDVTAGNAACGWIEQLAADQIMTGCGGGKYCPDGPVTRQQLAVFLGRTMRGTDAWRPELGDGATPNLPPTDNFPTPLETAGNTGQSPSITIGADGLGLVAYSSSLVSGVRVAHCSNIACTAATFAVADSGNPGAEASVAVGFNGLAVISYASLAGVKVAMCSDVACTSNTPRLIDVTFGQMTSITVVDGLPSLSYYRGGTQDLMFAHCTDDGCFGSMVQPVDQTGDVGQYSSVALGADGLPIISYYDSTNGSLKVAHCDNGGCIAPLITTLDNPGDDVGRYTSIVIGNDGLPLISYRDETNKALRVAHCNDVECTTAVKTTLFPGTNAGANSSITIGADGLGLIVSRSDTDDLIIAHCANVECTAANKTFQDWNAATPGGAAVTVAADGLPLIAFQDANLLDLRIAHCTNALCTPYFRRR